VNTAPAHILIFKLPVPYKLRLSPCQCCKSHGCWIYRARNRYQNLLAPGVSRSNNLKKDLFSWMSLGLHPGTKEKG